MTTILIPSGSQSLTQKAGRSAISQILGGGFTTIIRLGSSVFLARALTPTDFGLFGMALLLREFVFVMGSMDMHTGVIVKKDLTDDDLCTFFWSMSTLRVLMFLVTFFGAPLSVYIFDDPRIVDILRVVSLTFLMSCMAVTANAILSKNMKFYQMNILGILTALLESCLAVVLVLNTDLGYWALVLAMLIQAFVYNASLFMMAGWWPKFKFCKESFQFFFRFGGNGLGFSITNYLKHNLDYLLVGRVLGVKALGLYEFAYRIPHLVQDRISRPVGSVVLPTLSAVKDSNDAIANGYNRAVKYVSLISFPLLFGLAAVSDVAVPVLWGDQWASIIMPLKLLCICAALRVIVQPVGAIYNCKLRPDVPFKISLFSLVWTAIIVGILGHYFGINGVAVGMICSVFPDVLSTWYALRMIGAKFSKLLKALWPIFMSASVSGMSAYLLSLLLLNNKVSAIIVMSFSILIGAVFYGACLFFIFPKLINEILDIVCEVSGNRFSLSILRR